VGVAALLAGGFLVAIFRAFHDVRMKRDRALAEMKRRFDAMRYAFRYAGISASRAGVPT
jgi:hypothetical protein